jgi:dienelactone hydrolase
MGMTGDGERAELYSLLGDLPDRDGPATARLLGEEDRGAYVLEGLVLDLNGLSPVPAYFARPLAFDPPYPTVLYCHSHGGRYESGKEEFVAGQVYLSDPPYAEEFARRGIAGLCIDHWVFGERRGALGLGTESAAAKYFLWKGSCLWGMMVYDSLRALDYLRARPDVDPRFIVSVGMSMGATMSTWSAALDPGLRACVDICGQVDGESLIEDGGLDRHGIYYYVPGLLARFSMADIDALILPRPHLAIAGDLDPLTPAAGLDRISRDVAARYAEAGAENAWRLVRMPCGHVETAGGRREVLAFLDGLLAERRS